MEADFQQFYNLDLDKLVEENPERAGRLIGQLPKEARLLEKLNPSKDWTWEKETQSRILAKLDEIACILINTNRKKGKGAVKPEKQFQPDYVEKAKKKALELRKEQKDLLKTQIDDMEEFWKKRNPKVKFLRKKNDD